MEPSIHLSTQMNTPTRRTVAGSSPFPTDTEFISTSPYFRQSLSLITSLSGKSECNIHACAHTPTHTHKYISFFSALAFIKGLIASQVSIESTYILFPRWTLVYFFHLSF